MSGHGADQSGRRPPRAAEAAHGAPRPPADAALDGACGVVQQRFAVPYEYAVHFTRGAFEPANPVLREALRGSSAVARVAVWIDDGLAAAQPGLAAAVERYCAEHAPALELLAPPEPIAGGESAKDGMAQVEWLWARFQALRLDRHAICVVIGGGAAQDMAGFAAATAHRGLRVARMPSTVLAQCDGGVGVKNGVNAFRTKNFLGSFAPPAAVVNDLALIDTLPARDRIAGMAECVKVALIRDAGFFAWLCQHAAALARFDAEPLGSMIRRGAELHLQHIARSGDPFEFGSARPLDYGHWSAHKLESLSDYRLRHGEAVAIGMALDARIAHDAGWLSQGALESICGLLEQLGLPLWDEALELRAPGGCRRVLEGLAEFREHLGGELTLTLLADIGKAIDVHEMDAARVERALAWLRERAAA